MPHPITLSDSTFAALQSLAKAFVDTPETVIAQLAEEELERRNVSEPRKLSSVGADNGVPQLDPDLHEKLTHTRLRGARFDTKDLHRPNWNSLLNQVHIVARQRLGSFEALQRISGASLRPGRYEEEGFRYVAAADLSIQGVNSESAWLHSLGIARHLRVPIRAQFEWRHNGAAARPGQAAILEWSPPNLAVA